MWPFNTEEKKLQEFRAAHPLNGLIVPKNVDELPALCAASGFVAPIVVDERGHCTRTENQGNTSKCAAYSTTSFAENIMWRQTHCPPSYDYDKVYARAKELDGNNYDGTSLDHAMQAFLDVYPDVFDKSCEPKIIRCYLGNMNNLKYAVHKYGCIVGGFNITTGWYNCRSTWIDPSGTVEGGHAVLICGYNDNGVIIQNSWGTSWGEAGFAVLPWNAVKEQFIYGCTLKGCMKHIDD